MQASRLQILVQRGDVRIAKHVQGPLDRIGRDRRPRGQSFQQHEAERIGAAREDEDVGTAIGGGEWRAMQGAEEMDSGIACTQCRQRRAFADDDLAAGHVEREERLDILLHRDAADMEMDRAR